MECKSYFGLSPPKGQILESPQVVRINTWKNKAIKMVDKSMKLTLIVRPPYHFKVAHSCHNTRNIVWLHLLRLCTFLKNVSLSTQKSGFPDKWHYYISGKQTLRDSGSVCWRCLVFSNPVLIHLGNPAIANNFAC